MAKKRSQKTSSRTKSKKRKEAKRKPTKSRGTSSSKNLIPYLKPSDGFLHVDLPGKITPVQLELFPGLPIKRWSQTLAKVAQIRDGGNWWVGDALNYGEEHFGESYAQAASDTGLSEDTLMTLKYVAIRVEPINRIKELSWSHHREVAKFPAEEQREWLAAALKNGWNVRELKEALRKKGRRKASEKDGEDGESKNCETCGADKAPMRVCGPCASVSVEAVKGLGVDGALALLKEKPSKPQMKHLKWAFSHLKEPAFLTDQDEKDWQTQYEALRRIIEK